MSTSRIKTVNHAASGKKEELRENKMPNYALILSAKMPYDVETTNVCPAEKMFISAVCLLICKN